MLRYAINCLVQMPLWVFYITLIYIQLEEIVLDDLLFVETSTALKIQHCIWHVCAGGVATK